MKKEQTQKRISKRMKELRGKLRKKAKGGNYYYRLTITNGVRKEFALKTANEEEAIQKAADLDAVYEAPNQEVAFAQINAIKGFSKRAMQLTFAEGWEKYSSHPDRAIPHTVAEQLAYKSTYEEFAAFASGEKMEASDIDIAFCEKYADHLREQNLAVATHNRKLKRLRKIFDCLSEYYDGDNPFQNKLLFRKEREEQDTVVRRQAFTREQEQQLRDVLVDPQYKVMNKPEIRVIYYLGMFTGQRLKDCVLLQWQNVDMERKRIGVKQFKTEKEVSIPMADELFAVLQEAQAWKNNQYVCPKSAARYSKLNRDGKNVGNNLVNIDVLRVIRWIGLEPSVKVPGRNKKMTVYGFHSLRHSFASFCAEAGVPKAVLLSILGTDSEIADKYYTHVGDSAQRQAVEAISGESQQKNLEKRVQQAIALIDSASEPTQNILQKIREILTGK
ncbi:MAG: tyrosine-type recombinase/integrase [Lentisphaeria bacterium]|nr:tyrosine-type recombinase/integrase [Lentisphaeria bacterium]